MDQDAVDLALLVFRCAIGAVMAAHGVNHIWRGGKIEGTGRWFASLGMKPGILHAWLASLAELAAAISLVLGLLTPLGGAAVMATMLVALITNHRGNGFFIFRPGEGWEYVMTLVACGFALAIVGRRPVVARQRPGRVPTGPGFRRTADRARRRRRRRLRPARRVLAPRAEVRRRGLDRPGTAYLALRDDRYPPLPCLIRSPCSSPMVPAAS